MSETRWEYCHVKITTYRDGTGPVTENIEIALPGGEVDTKTGQGHGAVQVLNELGAEGWEVFDMASGIWLKRKLHNQARRGVKTGITDLDGDGD